MKSRWTLNRAGILNVYQYGDETIELTGGRLLLRGVNGSGKSTAMNMLLLCGPCSVHGFWAASTGSDPTSEVRHASIGYSVAVSG